jgi:hypothetical protein
VADRGWGRDKERRLHQFGLVAGLVLAVVVHLYIFFGPRVSYKPVLERAKIRRVLVAKPYRPQKPNEDGVEIVPDTKPVELAKSSENIPAPPSKTAESKKGDLSKKGADLTGTDSSQAVQKVTVETSEALVQGGEASAGQSAQDEGLEVQALDPNKSSDNTGGQQAPVDEVGEKEQEEQWKELLVQMEQQNEDIVQKKERLKTEQQRVKSADRGADEILEDSRIRIKVASYPPSTIEQNHPAIEYPELTLRESQLQTGICRVYIRVWTDVNGKIVKEELKTPSTGPERERYKVFIDHVLEEVRFWSLPRQEAQIHIDVLFEIK